MRIGELAAQSGVPTSTIRFYEKRGLLPEAKRLTSGYRHYDEDNVKQLKLIRFAQDLGFSLDEVSGMVANSGVDHDRALNHLQDKLRELESLIERMTEKKQNLATLISHLQNSWDNNECMSPESLNALMQSKDSGQPQ